MEKLDISFMKTIESLDKGIEACEGREEYIEYLTALKKIFTAMEMINTNFNDTYNVIHGHENKLN